MNNTEINYQLVIQIMPSPFFELVLISPHIINEQREKVRHGTTVSFRTTHQCRVIKSVMSILNSTKRIIGITINVNKFNYIMTLCLSVNYCVQYQMKYQYDLLPLSTVNWVIEFFILA
jgi:hypothetical protein